MKTLFYLLAVASALNCHATAESEEKIELERIYMKTDSLALAVDRHLLSQDGVGGHGVNYLCFYFQPDGSLTVFPSVNCLRYQQSPDYKEAGFIEIRNCPFIIATNNSGLLDVYIVRQDTTLLKAFPFYPPTHIPHIDDSPRVKLYYDDMTGGFRRRKRAGWKGSDLDPHIYDATSSKVDLCSRKLKDAIRNSILDAGKYNQDESIAQLVFYESRNGKLTAAVYIWPRDYLRIRASDGRTAASEGWLFTEIEGYVFYVKQATSAEKNLYSVLEADCPLPLIPFGKESDTPLVVDVWTFTIENDGNIAGVSNFQHYE